MAKKRWEFSKWLAILTTTFFFGVILFSLVVWFLQDRVPSEILSTVAVPFSSVTAFYFLKSGYENGKKIDGSYSCQEGGVIHGKGHISTPPGVTGEMSGVNQEMQG